MVYKCHVQSIYGVALLEYNNSVRDSLSTAMHPLKWWPTLKTFIFDVNSSLPLIQTDDSSITYVSSKMTEVFSTIFQNKQSDQVFKILQLVF